jgi:hypothetical protein
MVGSLKGNVDERNRKGGDPDPSKRAGCHAVPDDNSGADANNRMQKVHFFFSIPA